MNKTRILSFTVCLFILLLLGNAAHSGTFAKKLADVGSLQKTIPTNDGGYVLVINDSEKNRIVLRKIDSKGKKVWQRQLVSPAQETIEARGLGLANDGGIFLTVDNLISQGSNSRIAVLKLDARGRIQWNRGFQGPHFSFGNLVAGFDSIVGTADGGALAAGGSCGGEACEIGVSNGLAVVKLSSTGALEWSKTFTRDYFDRFNTVQLVQTADGGFFVGANSVLLRLNSSGEIEWKRLLKDFAIGSYYRDADATRDTFQATPDGGVILVSFLYSKGKLLSVKLDSSGNFIWKKATTFENFLITGAGLAVNSSPEGGYVLFGSVTSGGGEYHAFLAKAGVDGTIQSVSVFDGSKFDDFDSVYPNADGSTVLFGPQRFLEPEASVLFSGFDSNGNVPACSSPSSVKPIAHGFGKLSIKGVKIEEQSLSMTRADLAIKSKKFNKQASDLCP